MSAALVSVLVNLSLRSVLRNWIPVKWQNEVLNFILTALVFYLSVRAGAWIILVDAEGETSAAHQRSVVGERVADPLPEDEVVLVHPTILAGRHGRRSSATTPDKINSSLVAPFAWSRFQSERLEP